MSIELFSLGVMVEAVYQRISVQNRRFHSKGGPVDPKFQVEVVAPSPTVLLLGKLGHCSFVCMVYKSGQSFLPFCHNTRVCQTDRQTDRHNSHRSTASASHAAL